MRRLNSKQLLLISIAISLAIHLILAVYLNNKKIIQKNSSNKKPKVSYESSDRADQIWSSPGLVPCSTYDGIGILFNSITRTVESVAYNGPAYKAGVRVGDEIVTPLWNMDLKFGQIIEVKFKRNNNLITFTLIVDKVCKK